MVPFLFSFILDIYPGIILYLIISVSSDYHLDQPMYITPPHLRHKEEKEEEKQIKSKSKKALSNYLISWKPSYIRNYVSCLPNSPRDEEMRIAFSHRHLTHFLIDINFNPLILTPSLLEQIH